MVALTPLVIYAIVVGGLFFLLLARRVVILLSRLLTSSNAREWIFRHLQAHILRRTRLTSPVSRLTFLLQLIYWIGIACYNLIGSRTADEVSRRAAAATAFSTVILLLGDRLDFIADMLAVSRRSYRMLHSTFGVMATAQMSLHVVLQKVERKFSLGELSDRFAFMVSLKTRNRILRG